MNENIFNEQGLFKFNDEEFVGIISKNNNKLEFTAINPIFISEDDYLLVNGYVDGNKISFVMFNHPILISSTQTRKETYSINSLFVGRHFDDFNQIKFKNSSMKINNISSTIDLSSFQHNFTDGTEIVYSPLIIHPKDDYLINFEDFKIRVRLNCFYEKWGKLGNGEYANFKEDMSIVFEYPEPQNIDRITNDALILQNLFTFITGKSRIIELKGFDKEYENETDIIMSLVSDEIIEGRQYPSAIQLNESNIENIIRRWFENYTQLNSVYDLYFSLEEARLNPASLFLTYAQILESYHRQRYDGTYINKKEFEKISKKVRRFLKETDEIKNIEDEGHKTDLLNKIKLSIMFSYEFTLHERLLELFNELNEYEFFEKILNKFISNHENRINDFVLLVKNNRNYYTHYGKKKDNVLEGKDLIELNEALKLIIDMILLKEFEFPIEEINRITYETKYFNLHNYVSWM